MRALELAPGGRFIAALPACPGRGRTRGGPLLRRAFARDGENRAGGIVADFLRALEERVADSADRYHRDYIEARITCRQADGPERERSIHPTSQRPLRDPHDRI